MSVPFKTEVTGDGRLEYQTRYLATFSGERGPVVFSEQFEELTMTELDDHADTTEDTAVQDSDEHAYMSRIKFILALAVQRDARYAHANRSYLFGLGVNNKLREDFEVFAGTSKTIGGLA